MRTSGLVLDVYDDCEGAVLRGAFPTFSDVPESIKQATALSSFDRDKLPDDAFALVLVNGGEKLRKYACYDGGNTALSLLYFLENGHKLPVEAQKVAAANLVEACGWFQFSPPEPLEKIALGVGTLVHTALAVPVAQGTSQQIKDNLRSVRAFSQGGLMTPQQIGQGAKMAEVVGTATMPLSAPPPSGSPKVPIAKVARVGHLVTGASGTASPPGEESHISGEQADKNPQARPFSQVVDVTDKTPPKVLTEKKAYRYALPERGLYPLDSYAQVKAASAYFDAYVGRLSPEDRREYCVNMVKRANELSISVGSAARKYGASGFASDEEIKVAFDARRQALQNDQSALALLGEVEKCGRQRVWKDAPQEKTASALVRALPGTEGHAPWVIAAALAEFDKAAGLDYLYDRSIPDPYFSVFGEKTAEEATWGEVIGNEVVNAADLSRLALTGHSTLKHTFSEEFSSEFRKDPVGIFKSLPLQQKKMVMRMAAQAAPGNEIVY